MHTLPLKVGRQSRQICRVRGTGPLTMMEIKTTDVDVKEYIKIFGRLGEKMIFGDASAGLCCHSACENCEWRYSFDVLQSARPKWIPTYRVNKFEVPPSTFFACASLDKALTARQTLCSPHTDSEPPCRTDANTLPSGAPYLQRATTL